MESRNVERDLNNAKQFEICRRNSLNSNSYSKFLTKALSCLALSGLFYCSENILQYISLENNFSKCLLYPILKWLVWVDSTFKRKKNWGILSINTALLHRARSNAIELSLLLYGQTKPEWKIKVEAAPTIQRNLKEHGERHSLIRNISNRRPKINIIFDSRLLCRFIRHRHSEYPLFAIHSSHFSVLRCESSSYQQCMRFVNIVNINNWCYTIENFNFKIYSTVSFRNLFALNCVWAIFREERISTQHINHFKLPKRNVCSLYYVFYFLSFFFRREIASKTGRQH